MKHLDQADNTINISSYYTLIDKAATQQDKRSKIGDILKANAHQLYNYFGPIIVSKNNELRELKKDLAEAKQM